VESQLVNVNKPHQNLTNHKEIQIAARQGLLLQYILEKHCGCDNEDHIE
jgi:hypothetical protein